MVYNEIRSLRERIADPVGWRANQNKIKKESDWYYTHKEEEKKEKMMEIDYR
jgi:hypothetical protein